MNRQNIHSLITSGHITKAVKALREAMTPEILAAAPELAARLNHLEETYRYMREYFLNAVPDDNLADNLADLQAGLRMIARRIAVERRQPTDTSSYFAARRTERALPTTLASRIEEYLSLQSALVTVLSDGGNPATLRRQAEKALEGVFEKAWILDLDSRDDLRDTYALLIDNSTESPVTAPFELISQVVTGRMLGALAYCDPATFHFLLDLYANVNDERLEARILVALVLLLRRWPDVAADDRALARRLDLFSDSLVDYMRLRDVIMTLIRTRDTDRVARMMKEDLIPSLMKSSPKIMETLRNANLSDDLAELEENPEWQRIIRETGLDKKLMELTEMQSEGLDVMMQTFSNLKQFSFFRNAANWFLPFSLEHSALARFSSAGGDVFSPLLDSAAGLCDSDKYSLTLSLLQMPAGQMMALTSQMEAQMAELKAESDSLALRQSRIDFNSEATRFCRDLYRFMKLFPRREDYYDIFSRPFEFEGVPVVERLINEREVITLIAEFYFKAGYYAEALPLYRTLAESGSVDGHILEKIGYCWQVAGEHLAALENYEKAELFTSDASKASLWLIRKLALCNKLLGRFDKAAGYYRQALERKPDDTRLMLNLAEMLLLSGKRDDAMLTYHKAEYLHPDDPAIIRALVRAEVRGGIIREEENPESLHDGYEAAETLMLKLSLLQEPTPEDHIMSGHIAWLRGQRRRSISEYTQARKMLETAGDTSAATLSERLEREMRTFQGNNFNPLQFRLLLDQ